MSHPISAFSATRARCLILATCLALGAASLAQAADWKPQKPVTLVVPYSPGGGVDAQTRQLARQLERLWGQPVIVDNAAGADGLIGTRKVIAARPDGLTLLVQIPSITLIRHTPSYKGADPLEQLLPVSAFGAVPGVLVANAALPVKTMAELLRHCKAAAQPCSLGTTENNARLQARMLGTDLPNLIVANYKGGGQLITDLVANNVNLAIMGVAAVLPHQRSGALRILMTMGHQRSTVAPEVPSAVEAGFARFDSVTWYGLFAPKETPTAVVQAVAAAVREAVKDEGLRQAFATIGSEAIGNTPLEFAAIVKADADRNAALARQFPIE